MQTMERMYRMTTTSGGSLSIGTMMAAFGSHGPRG